MKDSIKTAILSAILFGTGLGAFASITKGLKNGIITGVVFGILFGLIICAFAFIQSKKFKNASREIVKNEKIVFNGGANHLTVEEAVGGWLFSTENELVFQSHEFNINNHKLIIPLNQIKGIKAILTHGYMPTGLQVITNDSVEKFVVFERKEWIKQINDAIAIRAYP